MRELDLEMIAEHPPIRPMRTKPSSRNSRAAFTLTELCVMLAVVAVLTMLVLPTLAATKPKDQTASCISNLHKWGLAQQIYAADNKDTLPCDGTMTPTSTGYGNYAYDNGYGGQMTPTPASPVDPVAWFNVLPPLAADQPLSSYYALPGNNVLNKYPNPGNTKGRIWVCPAARYANADPVTWLGGGVYGLFCYVMDIDLKLYSSICNGVIGNAPFWPTGVKMTSIRHPSAQVFMFDATYSPIYEGGRNSGTSPAARWNYFSSRHGKGSVIQFLDGHAAFFRSYYVTNGAGGCVGRQEKNNNDVWWNPNRDK